MKLIHSPVSPFVRKVHVTILETGLADQVELVEVATLATKSAPEAVAANPLGKIPALIRDSGPALHDSRVINRYLNDLAGANLYPEARKWEVQVLESMADGIMDAGVLMVYEHRLRPAEMVFDDWVEAQWGKITRTLEVIDDRWMSHLAGPLDAAQIAVGCALGYLDLRHDAREWRKGHGALDDWYAAFSERPSMKETSPL